VLALASLLYGYALGERSDRGVEAPTALPSITEPRSSPFTEAAAIFVTRRSGHTVPERAIEYLNGNWIEDIAIDADGLIWSTGPAGVVQWNPVDGTVTRHTTPDRGGPLGGELIATGAEGDVWVSGSSGLSHWDGRAWTRDAGLFAGHELPQATIETDFTRVATLPDGSHWVASRRENPTGETFQLHRTEETFRGPVETWELPGEVTALEPVPDGTLWMMIEDRAWHLVDGAWRLAIEAEGSWLGNAAFAPNGAVWFFNETRVMVWHDGRSTSVNDLSEALTADAWPRWIVLDHAGVLWAVAVDGDDRRGELIRVDNLSRHPIPAPNPTKPVVGADGTIWMGTSDGLVGFDGTTWSTLRTAGDPPLRETKGLAIDENGAVWMSTETEIVTWDGWTRSTHTPTDMGLAAAMATQWWEREPWVATRPGASLWAGFGCRAAHHEGDTWATIDPPPDIGDSFCRSFDQVVGPDGSLWMSTEHVSGATLYRYHNARWVRVAEGVEALAITDNGSVWGAGGGVMRLIDGEWSTVLDGLWFSSIAVAPDGSVWAGSGWGWFHQGSAGIWRFDDGVWSHVAAVDAVDLEVDSEGTVWAIGRAEGSQRGVWQIDPPGDYPQPVATEEFSAIAAAPDGSLWLAGPGRLLRLPAHNAIESTGS
jgi:ligand-binding sensor domain-containing protein